jgi:hypothetical protein
MSTQSATAAVASWSGHGQDRVDPVEGLGVVREGQAPHRCGEVVPGADADALALRTQRWAQITGHGGFITEVMSAPESCQDGGGFGSLARKMSS